MSERAAISVAIIAAVVALSLSQSVASDRPGLQQEIARVAAMATSETSSNDEVFAAAHGIWPAMSVATTAARTKRSSDFARSGRIKVSLMPMDLVLSQVALQTGANFYVDLRQAQASSHPEVLVIDAGAVTLTELKFQLRGTKFAKLVDETDTGLVFRCPLIIWKSGELVLEPHDRLGLDGAQGAFLINTGRLRAMDANIEGLGAANMRQPEFRPFIMTALSGSVEIANSSLSNLGFGDRPGMTGLTLHEGGLYPASVKSVIRDNVFRDVGSIQLVNANGLKIENNRFYRSTGTAIVINGGQAIDVRRNIIGVTAEGAHGIKATGGASNVNLDGNIIASSGSNGIFADRGVTNLEIRRNVVVNSEGSAISLVRAACVDVRDNVVSASDERGISIRNSISVRLATNLIIQNRGPGVSVIEQSPGQVTRIVGNSFSANRAGVFGINSAKIDFARNDFIGQTPVILDGELGQYTAALLQASAEARGVMSIDGSADSALTVAINFLPYGLENCLSVESN